MCNRDVVRDSVTECGDREVFANNKVSECTQVSSNMLSGCKKVLLHLESISIPLKLIDYLFTELK